MPLRNIKNAAIEAAEEVIKENIPKIVEHKIIEHTIRQVIKQLGQEIKQLSKQLRYNYKQRFKDTVVVTLQLLKEDENHWYVSSDYAEGTLHKKDAVKMGESQWLVSKGILVNKGLEGGAT